MKRLIIWQRISNYSTVVCAVVLIAKMFFRKYIEGIMMPMLIVGGIGVIVLLISEIVKFIIKQKNNG